MTYEEEEAVETTLSTIHDDLHVLLREVLIELKSLNTILSMNGKSPIVERPSFRIKSPESIVRKIRDKGIAPNDFVEELDDILGVRVILQDLGSLYELKSKLLASNRIEIIEEDDMVEAARDSGYRGMHLIFALRDKSQVTNTKITGELQLRTIAQHSWANFSHYDIYKSRPILLEKERWRIKALSDLLYYIDREYGNLGIDLKEDPFRVDLKSLHYLLVSLEIHMTRDDLELFFSLINTYQSTCGLPIVRMDICNIKDSLTHPQNKYGADLLDVERWMRQLRQQISGVEPDKTELLFYRFYAYFNGFYWPKRRLFELALMMERDKWFQQIKHEETNKISKLIQYVQELIILLEAARKPEIEKYIFTWQKKSENGTTMFWSPVVDNRYTVKALVDLDLITAELEESIESREHMGGIAEKHRYTIKCTEKGVKTALTLMNQLFLEAAIGDRILNEIEIEDFPAKWILPTGTCTVEVTPADEGPAFVEHDWWSNQPLYY